MSNNPHTSLCPRCLGAKRVPAPLNDESTDDCPVCHGTGIKTIFYKGKVADKFPCPTCEETNQQIMKSNGSDAALWKKWNNCPNPMHYAGTGTVQPISSVPDATEKHDHSPCFVGELGLYCIYHTLSCPANPTSKFKSVEKA